MGALVISVPCRQGTDMLGPKVQAGRQAGRQGTGRQAGREQAGNRQAGREL